MALGEFQSIYSYFAKQSLQRSDVVLGIGDDCALLSVPDGQDLAVSIDTLVAGVHFPIDTAAEDIGYKSLAVSLSDLAAVGAEPAWVTLAVSLTELDENWVAQFCRGFFALAKQHNVQLVGGDVTRGQDTITTQLHGFVPAGEALRRSNAKVGDLIYVTGAIGEAGLGLQLLQNKFQLPDSCAHQRDDLIQRLNRPEPRVAIGTALRGIANAAIDISDGLVADLKHILEQSQLGATIHLHKLPVAKCFAEVFDAVNGWQQPLTAGDDYELLFTVPQNEKTTVELLASQHSCAVTCIGEIEYQPGMRCYLDGRLMQLETSGYEHFA